MINVEVCPTFARVGQGGAKREVGPPPFVRPRRGNVGGWVGRRDRITDHI